MSALTTVLEQAAALLTGRSLAQVQADLAAHLAAPAGTAEPAWTLPASSVPVFLDRAPALTRAQAPAVVLEPAGTAGIERLDGEVGTTGSYRLTLRLVLGIYTRGDPHAVRADATFTTAHARLMGDPTLGGTATWLRLAEISFQRDEADLTSGWLVAVYECALALDEVALTSVLV